MTELAALGLSVRSDGVVVATDRLKDFQDAAGGAERASDGLAGGARNADDAVKREGDTARKAAGDNKRLGDETRTTEGAMHRLATGAGRVVGALAAMAAAAFSVGGYIRLADAWSDMQSRIGAASRDMQAAPELMGRMVDIANASYSPLSQTVEVYGRNLAVLRDLGKTASEAADFTEALNHALVTTATKGQDAEVVQNALSRAISIGGLRAMEYETIMSRSPRVLEAIAKEAGTTVLGLRKMAQEGKITGKVITDGLINSLQQLREEAGEMPATVADGVTRIQTGMQYLIGVFDQTTMASGSLAGALVAVGDALALAAKWASENGDTIMTVFDTVLGSGIALAAWFAGGYVISFAAATLSTVTLTGALVALKSALIATGFGALIVGAGYLIGKFFELVRATGSFGEAMTLLGEVAAGVWEGIVTGAGAIPHGLDSVWSKIKQGFYSMISELLVAWAGFLRDIADQAKLEIKTPFGTFTPISVGGGLEDRITGTLAKAGDYDGLATEASRSADVSSGLAASAIEAGKDKAVAAWDKMTALLTKAREESNANEVNEVVKHQENLEKLKGGKSGRQSALQSLIDELATEQEILESWYGTRLALINQYTDAELHALGGRHGAIERLEAEHQERLNALRQQEQSQTLSHYGTFFGNMATIAEAGGGKMLDIAKAFSIAEGILNSYKAYTQVLADPSLIGRPFLRQALAASTLAAGLAQVANMRRVSRGGGGGSAGGGAAAATGAGATAAPQVISIRGLDPSTNYSGQAVIDMVDAVQKELKNRGAVITFV